jgi:hypothetical protein
VRGSNARSEKEIDSPSDCQESDQKGDSARAQSHGGAQGRRDSVASDEGGSDTPQRRGVAAHETRCGQVSGKTEGQDGKPTFCGSQVPRQVDGSQIDGGQISRQAGKAGNGGHGAEGRAQGHAKGLARREEAGRQIVWHDA